MKMALSAINLPCPGCGWRCWIRRSSWLEPPVDDLGRDITRLSSPVPP